MDYYYHYIPNRNPRRDELDNMGKKDKKKGGKTAFRKGE